MYIYIYRDVIRYLGFRWMIHLFFPKFPNYFERIGLMCFCFICESEKSLFVSHRINICAFNRTLIIIFL